MERPDFTNIKPVSTTTLSGKVYPAMPLRVTIRNSDGTTLAQFSSDYNCFESNRILRQRIVWALKNDKSVNFQPMPQL